MTEILDRARHELEMRAAVVDAALTGRRAGLRLRECHNFEAPPEAEKTWNAAMYAYEQAVDALLAFLEEAADAAR